MAFDTLHKRLKGKIGPKQLNFAIDRASVTCTEYNVPDDVDTEKMIGMNGAGDPDDDDEKF